MLVAARVGGTRLIDNVTVELSRRPGVIPSAAARAAARLA